MVMAASGSEEEAAGTESRRDQAKYESHKWD